MNRCFRIVIPACAVVAIVTSCASHKVEYMDPSSNSRKIVTIGTINQQDWDMAASNMIDTLLMSGALIRRDGKESVVAIGNIQNRTQEHVDTDLLMKKIRIAILRSGKARITTAVGVGGPEDSATIRTREELRGHEEFDQSGIAQTGTILAPTFSVTGRIIETGARAGRTRQSTFTFQLTMTDLTTGTSVWEDEYEIVKQGTTRSAVGF